MSLRTNQTVDILVIGTGISGLGAGHYIRTELPQKSFAIVEACTQASAEPGTCSPTPDPLRLGPLHLQLVQTLAQLGHRRRAEQILDYLGATMENDLTDKIHYQHQLVKAQWSTERARWTVHIHRSDTGKHFTVSANWIFCGSGYDRYDERFTPDFPGGSKRSSTQHVRSPRVLIGQCAPSAGHGDDGGEFLGPDVSRRPGEANEE